jgi:putative peptidoglycan lipid II flippase
MLNTLNHYFLPALAPALFNLANILAGVFLAPWFEKWGILSIHAMAVGALAGGILQFAVQAPLLRRYGFRFRVRLDLRHEGLRRVGRLIAPAVIGISAVQINVLVSTQLASSLGYDGPISWLEYAFRLIYLPIGLFGVAVGVVNLREVSAYSAQKQWEELKETVANSIKLVTLLAMPSAVGLTILSRSIVRVLYEHGHFTASDTEWTALALAVYSAGLIGYSCIKVYVPTFYALNDTATPVRISIGCVGFSVLSNLALVAVLPRDYKYLGLAATTAVAALLNSLLLSRSFNKRLGTLERFKLKSALLRTGAAALAMGLVVFAASRYGALIWPDPSLVEEGVLLAVTMGGGMAVYFSACLLLKVEEASLVVRRFRR